MGAVDDEEILEAVRTALGPSGLARAATGTLGRCGELEATLDHTLIPEYRTEFSIRSARVVRADELTATVDLDAITESVTKDRGQRTKAKTQGPVQLVQEDGSWKVVDMVVDGVSLLSTVFDHEVSGSNGGLEITILGGRVFPEFVWSYVEVVNGVGRPVTVKSVTVGHRRSLLPGWRWAVGSLPLGVFPAGTTRLDVVALFKNAHGKNGIRLLTDTDVGLVDAAPESARPRRRVPVSTRFPWTWGSAITVAGVLVIGLLFGWWIAGLALIQVAVVTALAFEGHLRRGVSRRVLLQFCWTLAGCAVGAALFLANGGFGGPHGTSERDTVSTYVESETGAHVVRSERSAGLGVGGCHFTAWDVRTERRRYWVVVIDLGRGGSLTHMLPHRRFRSAQALLGHEAAAANKAEAAAAKMLGPSGKALAGFGC